MILVSNSPGVRNFRELIDYAKKNPGKLGFATAGMGTSFHMSGESLRREAGIDIFHVPYKGGVPVAQAIVSGEVPIALVSNTSGMSTVKTGRVTAVAILGDKRLREFPDTPIISDLIANVEIGLFPCKKPVPFVRRAIASSIQAPPRLVSRAYRSR